MQQADREQDAHPVRTHEPDGDRRTREHAEHEHPAQRARQVGEPSRDRRRDDRTTVPSPKSHPICSAEKPRDSKKRGMNGELVPKPP